MAKISAIVPVYNVKDYLDECVQSLVSQTYKDIEIILIDDGSTDGSSQLCDLWRKKDSRIKIIHTPNGGVSHARNIGLGLASGEYISFIDPDDWIDKDMYEQMMEIMLGNNIDLCIGEFTRDFKDKSVILFEKRNKCFLSREQIIINTFNWLPANKKFISGELCDKIFSKNSIKDLKFDESIYMGEDMLFYWYVLKNVKKAAYIPLFKYHYRVRKNSATQSLPFEKNKTWFKAHNMIFKSAGSENDIIKQTIYKLYIVKGIQFYKSVLVSDNVEYENDLQEFQTYLRHDLFNILQIPETSLRVKLGALYLMMPYTFCKFFSGLIKKL